MQILSNPHTHTIYSDGQCSLEAMVQRAIELSFRSIGFSDHSVQPFDTFFTIQAEQEEAYRGAIGALREKYKGQIRIYTSVELDAFAGICDRNNYDYLLLSAHYVEKDGQKLLVDSWPRREKLFALRDTVFSGDGAALAVRFFEMLGESALRIRPDILGHFDMVKMFNTQGELYPEDAPNVRQAKLEALDCVMESGAMLEINTGGMARGYIAEPYPSRWLIRRWRELGGRVILGSDSHNVDTLNFGFDVARDWLIADGFTSVVELGGEGEAMFVERALL